MQKMDWSDVSAQVATDDANKWDLFVPRDVVRVEEGRLSFPRRLADGRPHSLQPTGWATGQFCRKLGIPTDYFKRCPLALQDAQANYWLRASEKDQGDAEVRWLLRAKGDRLRGLLSERYARLGNGEVLTALAPLVSERFEVRWFALTDESMHLRITDPRLRRDVLPGDTVMAGLHIANSEVGSRSVTVDALVYRLVCANGLVRLVKGRSIYHRRHVAVSGAELSIALSGAIRDALMQGVGFIERLSEAAQLPIADKDGVIATIASDWGLSQVQQESVTTTLRMESQGHTPSLYHLVNAVTQTAQSLSPDDRYTLETLAGRLLEAGPPAVKARPRELEDTRETLSLEPLFAAAHSGYNGSASGWEVRS